MTILELSDYSMVIVKDSEDPYWMSLKDIYDEADSCDKKIIVDVGNQITHYYMEASEFLYSTRSLVLFFKDKITDRFHAGDKVTVSTTYLSIYK